MTAYELLKHRLDIVLANIQRLKNTSMGKFWESVRDNLQEKLSSMTIAEAERIIFFNVNV